MSATTSELISSIPSATPELCNTGVALTPPGNNVSRPYCSFNWPTIIPGVASSCCDEDAEIQTAYICTQFCERSDGDSEEWLACVQRLEPSVQDSRGSFVCHLPFEEDVTKISGTSTPTRFTTGNDMGSATSTGEPTQTSATGSDEDNNDDEEGAATLEQSPLTLMGWFVSLLAIGAGLLA